MFKRGLFKEYYQRISSRFEKWVINRYLNNDSSYSKKYDKHFGVLTYHESDPEICITINILGEPKIVVAGKNSRLEEVTKEDVDEALAKLKTIGKNSEDLKDRRYR